MLSFIETASDSLNHLNATMKKIILKSKGITGLSKMKAADMDQALHDNFSEEELAIVATNWLQKERKSWNNTNTLSIVIQRKISKQATFWLAYS